MGWTMPETGFRWQMRGLDAAHLPHRFDIGPQAPRRLAPGVFLNGEAWTTVAERDQLATWLTERGVREAFTVTEGELREPHRRRLAAAALVRQSGGGGSPWSQLGEQVLSHLSDGLPLPHRSAECAPGWLGCVMGSGHACAVAAPHNFALHWLGASAGRSTPHA